MPRVSWEEEEESRSQAHNRKKNMKMSSSNERCDCIYIVYASLFSFFRSDFLLLIHLALLFLQKKYTSKEAEGGMVPKNPTSYTIASPSPSPLMTLLH